MPIDELKPDYSHSPGGFKEDYQIVSIHWYYTFQITKKLDKSESNKWLRESTRNTCFPVSERK